MTAAREQDRVLTGRSGVDRHNRGANFYATPKLCVAMAVALCKHRDQGWPWRC